MGPLKKIIYNCKKATFLIDKKLVGKISFREHIELHIHLIGCGVCKLYNKQSKKINEMVRQFFKSAMNQEIKLDDNFKQELQQRIEKELNKN